MGEAAVEEVAEQIEDVVENVAGPEELAAFEAGFEGVGVGATQETEPVVPAPVPEANSTPIDTPSKPVDEPPVASSALDTAKLSDEVLQKVLAQVTPAIDKVRGDAFGKVGGLERTLRQLQESTPLGQEVEVKAEDLAELQAEFPGLNLGESLAKGLTRVLGKLKVKGAAPTSDDLSQMVAPIVDEKVASTLQKAEEARREKVAEALTEVHSDWATVIGGPDSDTKFRQWLKTQKPGYQRRYLQSWDPDFLADGLDRFKEFEAAEAAKAANVEKVAESKPANASKIKVREQQLREAIPPKGGGVVSTTSKKSPEEEAFEEGFRTGRE